ncbi:MAG TPA: hypothetical protein VM942_08180, partial [Acidimicrobiales bacterium]|nr:hypothetical protein [Acidimicrobiales bacterium]
MPRQTFIWTALPNGTKQLLPSSLEVGLTLSVFVTPRLQHSVGETRPLTLADFPDLHNWPETVNQMQFLVTFDRGVPLPAAKVSLLGVPADPDRWGALFKTDLRVEPYRFDDHSGDTWLSYPAGELARRIREGYVDATSPDAGGGVELLELVGLLERLLFEKLTLPIVVPPALRPLIDALPDPAIIADLRSLTGILGTIGGEPPVHIPGLPPVTIPGLPPVGLPPVGIPPVDIPGVPPVVGPGIPPVGTPPLGTIRNPLSEFMGFHMPPLRKERPERLPENRLRQLLDFHEIVSALGDYPAVLRALGLVVDLTIAVPPDLAEALLSAHTVQVRPVRLPTVGQIQTLDVSPATGCFLDGDLFLAAPRPQDPETARGLLDLADGRYQVEQFDIDGTMFKIQGEERSVASLAGTLNPTMPKDVGFPALRTAGITVVRDDLAERFARKAQQAKARNAVVETAERAGLVSADAGDVFAEDLTAGYRVDVWDDVSATWHSLHKRETDFAFVGSQPDASMPNVENEGMTQLVATKHPTPEDPSRVPAGTTAPILVSPAVLTWEGWSLSVPRPGRHITNPDPDPRHSATNERPTDPDRRALNGVNLSVSNRTTSGSGLPRLRIGRTYRLRARLVDLAGNSRRHDEADLSVRPEGLPQSSEAIRYGRFEPVGTPFVLLDRPPREGESVEWIVARSDPLDSESLAASDAATHRDFVPPRIGQLLAEQHGMLDTPGGKLDGSPEMYELLKKRDRGEFLAVPALPAHGTHVKRVPLEGPLKIPYLPDPMARGVLFVGLPGAPSATMPDQT